MGNKFKKKDMMQEEGSMEFIGPNLGFAGAEAYKLLRTNVKMSLPKAENGRIIGITSSVPGEGKSTTSLNLAYQMAQDHKKVLLVESDLRLPALAKTMGMKSKPGLADLLVGLCTINEAIRRTPLSSDLYLLPSGTIPPNPSELLGSGRMSKVLSVCAGTFDYVILDLPPISAVSDALTIANYATGLLVVARAGYCTKNILKDTLSRLKQVNVNVLGVVMTHAATHSKSGYGKYGKYGHYGKYGSYGNYGGYDKYLDAYELASEKAESEKKHGHRK